MDYEITDTIKSLLTPKFNPSYLDIQDLSDEHKHHPGNNDKYHIILTIKSSAFNGVSLIERHRMIYEELAELMHSSIHALQIKALDDK